MEDTTQPASSEVPIVKGDVVDLKTVDISVKVTIVQCTVSQNYMFAPEYNESFPSVNLCECIRFYLLLRIESAICL